MKIEYENFENSIFEKLCKTERSQALIIVNWLGAPEESLLKLLKRYVTVVDLSKKIINYLIPGQKIKSPHNAARARFDPSNTRKIFYTSTSHLPFISLTRLVDFFNTLSFEADDINIVFLLKKFEETVTENHDNKVKNINCYSDRSILENHSHSTHELYNFMHEPHNYFSLHGYRLNANNADMIICCNTLMTIAKESKNGNFRVSKTARYPVIPLRRPKHSYPNKELFDILSVLAKIVTPFSYENKFYSDEKHLRSSKEFRDIIGDYEKLYAKSTAMMGENEMWIFRTEEEQMQLDQEVWKERIKVQKYLFELVNLFPLIESDEEAPLTLLKMYDW